MGTSLQPLDDIAAVLHALRTRVHDIHDLLGLLAAPLKSIGLLPVIYDNDCIKPLCSPVDVRDHIPLIQHALIEDIAPFWETILREKGDIQLLEQYFCPNGVFKDASVVIDIVPPAYSAILSRPLTGFSVHLLQLLSSEYSMCKIYKIVFNGEFSLEQELLWEDYVRNLLSIPARVANRYGPEGKLPPSLEQAIYLKNVCIQCEQLIDYTSDSDINGRSITALVYLLTKLVGQGLFPSTPPVARSQVSFFQATIPSIRLKLEGLNRESYSKLWTEIIENIPSRLTLHSLLQSIFATLQVFIADDPLYRSQTNVNAQILQSIFGIPLPNKTILWECVMAILLDREWQEELSQCIVYWISGTLYGERAVRIEALQAFLNIVMNVWMSSDHINHSFVSRHRYITTLLLVIHSYLPPESVNNWISSPPFIAAVGCYISHMDESVRLCGMLAAEALSSMAGKVLTFDAWRGDNEARLWARHIRESIEIRATMNAEPPSGQKKQTTRPIGGTPIDNGPVVITNDGNDSDDSLIGYTSSGSSRSLSPVVTDTTEYEKEPTMDVGVKRVSKPIYLSQLSNLLQSQNHGSENDQPSVADKVETALNSAQGLIRRKKHFGDELEENAVRLVLAFLGLQDNYGLPQFDAKRQGVVNALVASCPHIAAPCIIEEFFKPQYSVAQRFVALEALVFGARELTTSQPFNHQSKVVPLGNRSLSYTPMQSSDENAAHVSNGELYLYTLQSKELSREKPGTLRVFRAKDPSTALSTPSLGHAPFILLSAPCFISPLIARFWLFLRDEQGREQRTMLHQGIYRYHGAGSAMVLSPIVLAQLLRTLAILVHLSRLSSEWLALVAPDSLEMALTIGTLPVSRMELGSGRNDGCIFPATSNWERKNASVLTAALELALVVLNDCLELDHGRFLSLQHATLLQRTGEWGRDVFSRLNQGFKFSGGGGKHETSLARTVTGVLLKVDDIIAYWRQSMATLPFS